MGFQWIKISNYSLHSDFGDKSSPPSLKAYNMYKLGLKIGEIPKIGHKEKSFFQF
jgi:hypothetical protein